MVTNIVNSPHYLFQIVSYISEFMKSRDKKSELGEISLTFLRLENALETHVLFRCSLLINVGFCQVLWYINTPISVRNWKWKSGENLEFTKKICDLLKYILEIIVRVTRICSFTLRRVLFWMVEKYRYWDRESGIKSFEAQPSKIKPSLGQKNLRIKGPYSFPIK